MYFILFLLWDSLRILKPVEITKNANSKWVIIIMNNYSGVVNRRKNPQGAVEILQERTNQM